MLQAAIRVVWVEVDRQIFDQFHPLFLANQDIQLEWSASPEQAAQMCAQPEAGFSMAVVVEVAGESALPASSIQPLETLQRLAPGLPLVWLGRPGGASSRQVLQAGVVCILREPLDAERLSAAILFVHRRSQESHDGQSMFELAGWINSAPDIPEVFRRTCQAAARLFGVEHSGLVQFDPDLKMGRVIEEYSSDGRIQLAGHKINVSENTIELGLLASQKPVIIEDVAAQQDLGELRDLWQQHDIQSLLIVPVIADGRVIASFSLDSIGFMRRFSADEQNLSIALAGHAAQAYEKIWRWEIHHRFQHAVEMINQAEQEDLYQQVVSQARDLFSARYALLWPFEASRDNFSPEGLVGEGFTSAELKSIQHTAPQKGQLTWQVLKSESGYLGVPDQNALDNLALKPGTAGFLQALGVHAFQAVRLGTAAEPVGVLYLDYVHPRSFRSEEHRILSQFAQLAGVSIKRDRAMQWASRSWTASQDLVQKAAEGDLSETLLTIVENARFHLDCDLATVYVYSQADRVFTAFEGSGQTVRDSMRHPNDIGPESSLFRLLNTPGREPIMSEHAERDFLFQGNFVKSEKIKAACGLKLLFKNEPVGVMFVDYRYPHHFQRAEIEALSQYGHLAAIAIHTAQLHEQVNRRAAALKSFFDSNQAARTARNLDGALAELANRALKAVGPADRKKGCFSHITLLDEDERHYRFVAAAPGEYLENLKKLEPIDICSDQCGIVGRVIRSGSPERVPDVDQDPNYLPYISGIQAQVSVPLRRYGRVIGGLSVEHPAITAFRDEDLEILSTLGAQVVQTIGEMQPVSQEPIHSLVVKELANQFKTRFDCDLVTLYTIDPQRQDFSYPPVMVGKIWDEAKRPSPQLVNFRGRLALMRLKPTSALNRVLKAGHSVFSENVSKSEELRGDFTQDERIVAAAAIPLRAEEQLVGAVFLNYRREHEFDFKQQREMDDFANLASLVLGLTARFEALLETKGAVGGWIAQAWMNLLANYWSGRLEDSALAIVLGLDRLAGQLQRKPKEEDLSAAISQLSVLKKQVSEITRELRSPSLTSREVEEVWIGDLIQEFVDDLRYQEEENPLYQEVNFYYKPNLSKLTTPSYAEWVRYALEHWIGSVVQVLAGREHKEICFSAVGGSDGVRIEISDSAPPLPTGQLQNPWMVPPAALDSRVISLSVVQGLAAQFGGLADYRPASKDGENSLLLFLPKSE